MEVKEGSGNVLLYLKPRLDGQVVTMETFAGQYGEATPANGTYKLIGETVDKTLELDINSSSIDANGMFFTIPSALFLTANVVFIINFKYVLNGKTDFGLYHFEIRVTRPEGANAR